MRRGRKKYRSEPQHHHGLLFHKSRHDPLAYYKTCLEDLSETVEKYREMVRVAEVDARHSKKALANTQTQVGPLQVVALTPWISESIDAVDGTWSPYLIQCPCYGRAVGELRKLPARTNLKSI